jgi:hypothetical protein
MAGHDRSGELIANMTDEDRRLSRLYRPVDIVIRVVPGPSQAAGAPERDQGQSVRFPEISYMHRHHRPVL